VQTLSHVSPLVCWSFEGIAGLVSAGDATRGATAQRQCGGGWHSTSGLQDCKFNQSNFKIEGQSVGDDRRSGDAM